MAINQKSTIAFSGGAKITGLPVSSANGEAVVHEQLTPLLGGLVYQGDWNATTGLPAIPAAAPANKGHYYIVSTGGATNINGITDWAATDWIVSNGTAWTKVDNSENAVAAATDTTAGVVELATAAETTTGTDTARAVTPAGVAAAIAAIPLASETVSGRVELATNAEAIAGTDTDRALTAANLAAVLAGNKYVQTFGGATANIITHNLNTTDVLVQVREVATNDVIGCDIQMTSVNTVTLGFTTAPAANSHRVVISRS
jgi:hypothetical protein